jgi:Uma2 family endonuclease
VSSVNVEHDEIIYPSSDGQPMAETSEHLLLMVALISALRHHFKQHRKVYVIGNMFLYYEKGNPAARRAPDIMVVKGVDPSLQRRSFKTWVEKAMPSTIIELTSSETAQEDQEIMFHLYQMLGIRECFLFDPLNEYLPRQLMGFLLVGQRYEQVTPDDEDAFVSEELGLRLVPQGTDLVLLDSKTGKRLSGPDELKEELERSEKALQKEKKRALQQQQQAEREKQRAEALAAEVARLRAQLKHPPRE